MVEARPRERDREAPGYCMVSYRCIDEIGVEGRSQMWGEMWQK